MVLEWETLERVFRERERESVTPPNWISLINLLFELLMGFYIKIFFHMIHECVRFLDFQNFLPEVAQHHNSMSVVLKFHVVTLM